MAGEREREQSGSRQSRKETGQEGEKTETVRKTQRE
jgi:hypothetical protein